MNIGDVGLILLRINFQSGGVTCLAEPFNETDLHCTLKINNTGYAGDDL